jgi:hypothetical protein
MEGTLIRLGLSPATLKGTEKDAIGPYVVWVYKKRIENKEGCEGGGAVIMAQLKKEIAMKWEKTKMRKKVRNANEESVRETFVEL